ncbi:MULTISPECIES: capsular biosynthesis protein [unclassified Gilliamella]|uniref:capsular biosynthesis protein n=1 Tax=unclassified Gilliamella TaxID=2685620 RepID=UPI00132AE818|nr:MULTISPECIES: capsular biosynthesis protein [unclassified Gilliamella]MWN31258.1 capsular biosynthesis protein [Gilliamella sp. Pra-s60]MWP29897.1 capsular biosynthesis protein [Gilliamella sp. Pra-s54]
MIIILSAKYTEQDLRIEFGKIPPSFLPVGNKRLYHYQIGSIRDNCPDETIYLTLPASYNLHEQDKLELDLLNIKILYIEDSFSLGQSVAFSLSSVILNNDENVTLYYGDTLLENGLYTNELSDNIIFTSHSEYNYIWLEMPKKDLVERQIFCGILTVSHPLTLVHCLIASEFDLSKSLELYNDKFSFKLEKRDDWLDFGHLNTFYDSKTIVTTQRAFNELKITKYYVEKKSHKSKKLEAEANWFRSIPENLIHFTPRLIDARKEENYFSYKLDYLYCPTLTEMFVFGNHPSNIWSLIINSCFNFLSECKKIKKQTTCNFYSSLVNKNNERLSEFLSQNPIYDKQILDDESNPYFLRDILKYAHGQINSEHKSTFVHGDFCFSNILFDFQRNNIKVIDPRGLDFDNNFNVYGDLRYDLAKLVHSAIGKYDFIVSDRFTIKENSNKIILELPSQSVNISYQIKNEIEKLGYSFREILAITITLFLSMLPLHYDKPNRQKAFIATAIKLYKDLRNDNYSDGRS